MPSEPASGTRCDRSDFPACRSPRSFSHSCPGWSAISACLVPSSVSLGKESLERETEVPTVPSYCFVSLMWTSQGWEMLKAENKERKKTALGVIKLWKFTLLTFDLWAWTSPLKIGSRLGACWAKDQCKRNTNFTLDYFLHGYDAYGWLYMPSMYDLYDLPNQHNYLQFPPFSSVYPHCDLFVCKRVQISSVYHRHFTNSSAMCFMYYILQKLILTFLYIW